MRSFWRPRRFKLLLTCAIAAAIGALGSQAGAQKPSPKAKPEPLLAPVALGADQLGGVASTHIIVQIKPGVARTKLAGQVPSLRFEGEQFAAPVNDAKAAQQGAEQRLDALMHRWKVQSIEPAASIAPANIELARQIGLDRYYLMRVGAGTDTRAMAAEVGAIVEMIDSAQVDGIGGIASGGGPIFPNDPNFSSQWNMNNTAMDADANAPQAWGIHQGSGDTIVAILDTGVHAAHPEFAGRVLPGWNTVNNNSDANDCHGHGTHCTGTLAAMGNNAIGIAGMNWNTTILPVRVVQCTGVGDETQAANGVLWATDSGAHIISMSLQYSAGTDFFRDSVAYAWDSGVLPIAATGNNSAANVIAYPAKFPKCMAVGATTSTDARWLGSNTGPEIDVVAPGAAIYSTCNNMVYCGGGLYGPVAGLSGTSMAVPHVSGIASLIRSHNPALTVAQIEQIIKDTAKDLGAAGWDNQYGWGRVDAHAALVAATPVVRPADLNNDGQVNVDDLLIMLAGWGTCAPVCPADIAPAGPPRGDGQVNVDDLLALLADWG